MNTHQMHLHNEPFTNIKNGTKTIELRLNDEKRRLIQIGDVIVFTNRSTNERVKTKVLGLHQYKSFAELYQYFDKISLGYNEDDEAKPEDMEIYYPKEEQNRFGVLGIEVKVVNE